MSRIITDSAGATRDTPVLHEDDYKKVPDFAIQTHGAACPSWMWLSSDFKGGQMDHSSREKIGKR